MRNLRAGVTRVREELEALAQRRVVEVTAAKPLEPATSSLGPDTERVYVGTEAVLHQLDSAHAVIFLDFDQELLAPRALAAEQAGALLVRAARLVGARDEGGRVVVQTRLPRHEVIDAALHADPGRLAVVERARREELALPPFAALALVSGPAAGAFAERLGRPLGVDVLGPMDGRYLVRAADHATLCAALAAVERPAGRLRIAVDPHREL
jgi:primosomal protein N' (replication factor Y)